MTFNVSPGVYDRIIDFMTGTVVSGNGELVSGETEPTVEPSPVGAFQTLLENYTIHRNYELDDVSGDLVDSTGNAPADSYLVNGSVLYNRPPLLHSNQSSGSLVCKPGTRWHASVVRFWPFGLTPSFTMGFFVNFKSLEGSFVPLDIGGGTSGRDRMVLSNPSEGVLRIEIRGDATATFDYNGFNLLETYFILFSKETYTNGISNDEHIYVNGQEVPVTSGAWDQDNSQTTSYFFVTNGNTEVAIDKFFIHNGFLTEEDASALYETAQPLPDYTEAELFS